VIKASLKFSRLCLMHCQTFRKWICGISQLHCCWACMWNNLLLHTCTSLCS